MRPGVSEESPLPTDWRESTTMRHVRRSYSAILYCWINTVRRSDPGFPPEQQCAKRPCLTVCRGSSETNRLKSGAGNYRFTPLAKIQFWGATRKAERIEKAPKPKERRRGRKKSIWRIANSQAVRVGTQRASLPVSESADPVVRRGRPPSSVELTEKKAD